MKRKTPKQDHIIFNKSNNKSYNIDQPIKKKKVIKTNFSQLPPEIITIIIDYIHRNDLDNFIILCKLTYQTFLQHKRIFIHNFKNNLLIPHIHYLINKNKKPYNYINTLSELNELQRLIQIEKNKFECLKTLYEKKKDWTFWINQKEEDDYIVPKSSLTLEQRKVVFDRFFNQISYTDISVDKADYHYIYEAILNIEFIDNKNEFIRLTHYARDDSDGDPNFTITYNSFTKNLVEKKENTLNPELIEDEDEGKVLFYESVPINTTLMDEMKRKFGLSFVTTKEFGELLVFALPWPWRSNLFL
ncbi:hypothetical protein ABK040_003269 [Willaertia magna]